MKNKLLLIVILILTVVLVLSSCSAPEQTPPAEEPEPEVQEEVSESEEEPEEVAAEPVELAPVSSSLTQDGKWLTVINETYANPSGLNESPALRFNEIPGAGFYAIYMIDVSASNWVHWIARNVTVTELAQGAVLDDSDYVGPYPPSGIHTYEIHIYALAVEPVEYPGTVNGTLSSIEEVESALDSVGGGTGNILASAVLSGTVEAGGAIVE